MLISIKVFSSNEIRLKKEGDNIPKIAWEKLDAEVDGKKTNSKVWRSKVPGGWLVRIHSIKEEVAGDQPGISWAYGGLTFIPDPGHTWDGNSLP